MRKQVLAISLGLLTFGSFAQKKELKLAEKAVNSKDFAGALTTLNELEGSIVGTDLKYQTKFYYLKGKSLAGKKKYSEAIKAFDKLQSIDKSAYMADVTNVKTNIVQEVSEEAIDLYSNKKDYKAAAEKFYLTYQLSPTDTSFVFNAAVSATEAKDFDTALKHYTELKNIGYTGIETQYVATNKTTNQVENLGSKSQRDLMVKAGKYVKPEVKTTESKSALIVKNIAFILKQQGKKEEAIAAFKEARAVSPKDVNLLLNEASLYIEMNDMDKFGELMNEAVALKPNDPTLYYNLGVVNFNQGRMEEAKKYYKKAVELDPTYSDAYMNLAITTLEKDKEIVEEMNNNLSNFKKYDELALQQKAVYQEALPYLEKADELNRSSETVRTLMTLYDVLEKTDKADEYRTLYKSMK